MDWKHFACVAALGLALLPAEARVSRALPDLGGERIAISRDVLITVELVAVRDVGAGGRNRQQDSTLTLRQLVSLRSHYAGPMTDTQRRSHAPLACWGTRRELPECGPGQRFTGELKVPPASVQPALFRFNELRWQAGDALTVHTQVLALSANDREARLQHIDAPVMKVIPLRDALQGGRRGEASTHVIRLQAGERQIELTYRVRATPAG